MEELKGKYKIVLKTCQCSKNSKQITITLFEPVREFSKVVS